MAGRRPVRDMSMPGSAPCTARSESEGGSEDVREEEGSWEGGGCFHLGVWSNSPRGCGDRVTGSYVPGPM